MIIAIYTLTSELHDQKSVDAATREFLGSIVMASATGSTPAPVLLFKGSDYADFGSHTLSLIYVRTGGTEGIFKGLLPTLRQQAPHPFYLLTSGKSNSLAASMEILSYLRQQGIGGEIIHGSTAYITSRIATLARVEEARRKLRGQRLGVIGKPSDWLIASHADRAAVKERLGIELVHIPMGELLAAINGIKEKEDCIYQALRAVIDGHGLQGFTLRCFDLLTTVRDTGCLALAKLNAEGFVAGCEGDVPAMLSMAAVRALTGMSGFQANPATIDPETGEMVFAHCTIPLDMVESYELDTHFESGIGVAVRGHIKEGPVTLFKVSGDLSRCFIAEGTLLRSEAKPNLCRTQLVVRLADKSQAAYFLTNPIGNHHIVALGHYKTLLAQLFQF